MSYWIFHYILYSILISMDFKDLIMTCPVMIPKTIFSINMMNQEFMGVYQQSQSQQIMKRR